MKTLSRDLSSGLIVFLVALPLCLGIALASNAPIIAGLLSGIVGGIVVGILSGSHTSVSGPSAGLAAVIVAQITTLGSFENFLIAMIIAGAVQILLGILRTGFVSAFFPTSVIKGLLAAIGFILILKQIPHLVGLDVDYEGEMAFWQNDQENTFSELLNIFTYFHVGALSIGLLCLALLLIDDRISWIKRKKIPMPLVVVVIGSALSVLYGKFSTLLTIEAEHRVAVPIISSLADIDLLFARPNFASFGDYNIWVAGITLAIVASLETLLNLEAIDKLDPKQRVSPPNRELIAQGIGNTLLGFIGGLPTTSAIIRSSININANAQSKNSAIFHGLFLLGCVLVLPLTLNQIPLSCLAAILIVTGAKLAHPRLVKTMWSEGLNQFVPFAITFLAIVFTDLLFGVSIGLVTSLLFILKSNLNAPLRVVQEHHLIGEIYRIILGNQASFLNRARLKRVLQEMPNSIQVVIDASETDYIDADILDLIKDFQTDSAPQRDIVVNFIGFKGQHPIENDFQFVDYATWELQKNAQPEQLINALQEGNLRTRQGKRLKRDLHRQIKATAPGQFPLAVVLSCMDSRAPVELVFDQGIGDIFSIRMAGNVVSERVIGSLEYATKVAGAKLIVVMGHTKCGAIAAAYQSYCNKVSIEDMTGCQNLGAIIDDLHRIIESSQALDLKSKNMPTSTVEDHICEANVNHSLMNIIKRSPAIADLIANHSIAMVGCVYDIESGTAKFLPPLPATTRASTVKQHAQVV